VSQFEGAVAAKLKSDCERKGGQWRNDLRVNPHGRPQSHREIAATLAESRVLGNMNPGQFTEQVNNHLISQAWKSIWGTELPPIAPSAIDSSRQVRRFRRSEMLER
jgi:hypothetical protein